MGRKAIGDPVKHIISVRVNDSEYEFLQEQARVLGINLSTLLRKSLGLSTEVSSSNVRGCFKKIAVEQPSPA